MAVVVAGYETRPGDRARHKPEHSPVGVLLQGRWRILAERPVFQDRVSTIFRARDQRQAREVAVKVYRTSDPLSLQKLRRSVEILLTFRGRFTSKGCRMEGSANLDLLLEELRAQSSVDYGIAHAFVSQMDFRSSFVELISFSHDSDWNPTADPENGLMYIIMELGDTSLQKRMTQCVHTMTTMDVEELRSIHWALVTAVCGLNTEGYMHFDLKPSTLFRYTDAKGVQTWKLVDLDGAIRADSQVRAQEVVHAEQYCSPELAQLLLRVQREGSRVQMARHMNVWSIGMLALETVALMPAYDLKYSWFQKWREKDGRTTAGFLASVAGEHSRALVTDKMIPEELAKAMCEVSPDMLSILEGMLSKDPKRRSSIVQCLLHKWFACRRKAVIDARWRINEDDDLDLPGSNQVDENGQPIVKEQEENIGSDIRAYIKAQIERTKAERAAERAARAARAAGVPLDAPAALPDIVDLSPGGGAGPHDTAGDGGGAEAGGAAQTGGQEAGQPGGHGQGRGDRKGCALM